MVSDTDARWYQHGYIYDVLKKKWGLNRMR